MTRQIAASLALVLCMYGIAAGQTITKAEPEQAPGVRRALIVCGHPGDDEHRTLYAELIEKLRAALVGQYGFAPEDVAVHFGDDMEVAPPIEGAAASTQEAIKAGVERLRDQLQPADTLWVVVVGHAHFDGRKAFLNLPGQPGQPDPTAEEFGKLFEGLAAREQVFFMTTSLGGFFIKPLSVKGRIVIAATEADLELNETLFPRALADVLAEPPADNDFDVNGDALVSIYDLYIVLARNVAQRYIDEMAVQTEHAQLDDTGDGAGSEVQLDYLTEEQGGRATEDSLPAPITKGADGELAARTPLKP